jgi:hypothetical protein
MPGLQKRKKVTKPKTKRKRFNARKTQQEQRRLARLRRGRLKRTKKKGY